MSPDEYLRFERSVEMRNEYLAGEIEVLSDSTEEYDRGEKFAHYRRLESLREYVLVAQNKMRVERYERQGEQWLLSELHSPDDTLHLASIDCTVNVAAIYENIEL